MTTTLVEMKEDDLAFVNKIRNDSSTRCYLRNNKLISLDETYTWFRTSSPKWFIIDVDGQKVGYIRTSHDTGETICCGCDIHPEHRGKGHSKSAYNLLIEDLYNRGYVLIWLEVFRDNVIAYNLYKKLGFIEVGPIKRNIDKRPCVTMVHKVI
jgi:ribosomal protein S18 acetylase RimI-like enzyme